MSNIPAPEQKIPRMFRAQIKGRSQLQFISKQAQQTDSERWVAEWIERVETQPPSFGEDVQTQTYTFSWRFVTNGGQDEGIIRPVMGAYGLPFYPGSSMKGAFCQVCTRQQRERYRLTKSGEQPSLLRFHGGYPVNDWTQNLLDIVHPQQGWQVKTTDTGSKPSGESGYALVSLYQPTFEFGISSLLADINWDEVWTIWEKALGFGIGCRVSSGYGLPKARLQGGEEQEIPVQGELLYKCYLSGQGQAPQLLDNQEGEFRPNIFRGALRGHALRIFGGLAEDETAEDLVDTLFGGVRGEGKQGLLAIAFKPSHLDIDEFSQGYDEPTYEVTGELRWLLTQPLAEAQQQCLKKLVRELMLFAMLFGGFGKSWRRADHRDFYEQYYQQRQQKPLIGCHWQWHGRSLVEASRVRSLKQVGQFIESLRQTAQVWMNLQGVEYNPELHATWREIWHPDNVQVWGRIAEDQHDCLGIQWFHQPYQLRERILEQPELSIKRSSLTGSISQVGRIWHRMYPLVMVVPNPQDPKGKKRVRKTPRYLELLTIFPDSFPECQDFLDFLAQKAEITSSHNPFQRLWLA
ncbi:MAG: RAMP superfamily protein [Symploca sp. SIO3C6]|nr:RAMP superfamily protein [Symploca sp. SIO3C6]